MIYNLVVRETLAGDSQPSITQIIGLNVTSSYSESYQATAFKNVVEDGFPISDGLTQANPVFEISGIISEYNIFSDSKEISWSNDKFSTSSGEKNTLDDLREIKKVLSELITKEKIFSILTTSETYDRSSSTRLGTEDAYSSLLVTMFEEHFNIIATNVTFDQPNGMDSAFNVRLGLEKIRVAKTQVVELSQDEQTRALRRTEVDAKVLSQKTSTDAKTPSDPTVKADKSSTPESGDGRTQDQIKKDYQNDATVDTNKAKTRILKEEVDKMNKLGKSLPYPLQDY